MILREATACRLTRRALVGVCLLGLLALPALTLGQVPRNVNVNAQLQPDDRPAEAAKPDTAGANREERMRRLEEKVKALLKEFQELKGARPNAPPRNFTPGQAKKPDTRPTPVYEYYRVQGRPLTAEYLFRRAGDPAELTLSRVSYALPAGKAEAVAKFLREHVKAAVLETALKEHTLIVTTTPQVQRDIASVVRLVRGQAAVVPRKDPVPK
jgi:hypothetical protein